MISLYQERLHELCDHPCPTSLMKCVISALQSDVERVYIYEVREEYASLFVTSEIQTIYFYPDLHCSLLTPPITSVKPSIARVTSTVPFDEEWITSILAMDASSRYESDADLLQYKDYVLTETPIVPKIVYVSLEDDDESNEQLITSTSTTSLALSTSKSSLHSTSKTSLSQSSVASFEIRRRKPIPVHDRPKWKR